MSISSYQYRKSGIPKSNTEWTCQNLKFLIFSGLMRCDSRMVGKLAGAQVHEIAV